MTGRYLPSTATVLIGDYQGIQEKPSIDAAADKSRDDEEAEAVKLGKIVYPLDTDLNV